jgi:tetratricopeptide (TPR) repeat protein
MTPRGWLWLAVVLPVKFLIAADPVPDPQTNVHPRDAQPQPGELLYKSPGHYVLPGEGPDYFSPHYRPFPDFYTIQRNQDFNRLPSRTAFGRTYGPLAPSNYASNGYASCTPYVPFYPGDAEAAYDQGRYDADREYLHYLAAQRAGRLLNQYRDMFDDGMRLFHQGAYDLAAVKMMGAAQSNESNAACRLHAAHALFALGQYRRAADFLARAFELSPSLPFKTYDIRDEYADPAQFQKQLVVLRTYINRHPRDDSALTVLGYVTYYTRGPAASYPALRRAGLLNPNSFFIPKLLDIASQTVPQNDAQPPSIIRKKDAAQSAFPRTSSGSRAKSKETSGRHWTRV